MAYAILFQPDARRELASLQRVYQRRVVATIESLTNNPRPHGCAKMSGFQDIWRIRVGAFRIIYRIRDRQLVVEVIRIGHRREVYRGL
jgi:mRNA interferase RelE/StbE